MYLLKFAFQVIELFDLAPDIVASLFDLKLLFLEKLCLLINAIFDSLKSYFASDTERIAFKDIFTPFDPISFDIGEQLLDQYPFIVQFLLGLNLRRQIKINLCQHLVHGVIKYR